MNLIEIHDETKSEQNKQRVEKFPHSLMFVLIRDNGFRRVMHEVAVFYSFLSFFSISVISKSLIARTHNRKMFSFWSGTKKLL